MHDTNPTLKKMFEVDLDNVCRAYLDIYWFPIFILLEKNFYCLQVLISGVTKFSIFCQRYDDI